MSVSPQDFIRQQTRLIAPSAVPELNLWLADEVTPLWQATEEWLKIQNCNPPYWAFAWPGGQALARHAFDNAESVAGRRVFDFAAGGGVASIAAMKAGAAYVCGNDIDALACAALELNAAHNNVAVTVDQGSRIDDDLAEYDLIFAGDVCYDKKMAAALLPWLHRLAAAGKEVWLADPGRAYLPEGASLQKLASYTIPTTLDLEDRTARETVLYKLS